MPRPSHRPAGSPTSLRPVSPSDFRHPHRGTSDDSTQDSRGSKIGRSTPPDTTYNGQTPPQPANQTPPPPHAATSLYVTFLPLGGLPGEPPDEGTSLSASRSGGRLRPITVPARGRTASLVTLSTALTVTVTSPYLGTHSIQEGPYIPHSDLPRDRDRRGLFSQGPLPEKHGPAATQPPRPRHAPGLEQQGRTRPRT